MTFAEQCCTRPGCGHRFDLHGVTGDLMCDAEGCECDAFRSTPAIVHRGAYHERVESGCDYHGCLREKAFADGWEATNATEHVLALLSMRVVDRGTPGAKLYFGPGGSEYRARSWSRDDDDAYYTQRDATVAATIVQWLGSNVGFCWLEDTLRRAGYVVELKTQRDARDVQHITTTELRRLLRARDAAEQRLNAVERALDDVNVTDLMLAALTFAAAHCENEEILFAQFVEQQIQQKSKQREPFDLHHSAGTLHEISIEISRAHLALRKVRDALAVVHTPTTGV